MVRGTTTLLATPVKARTPQGPDERAVDTAEGRIIVTLLWRAVDEVVPLSGPLLLTLAPPRISKTLLVVSRR